MKKVKNSGFIVLVIMMLLALSLTGCDNGSTGGITVSEPNTKWYTANPAATSFTIKNANELAGLAEIVNAGTDDFEHDEITLAADLNLAGYSDGTGWTPIGTIANPFKGTFEGNKKSISNLFINSEDQFAGLFGYLANAEIRNLGVVSGSVTGCTYAGALAGSVEASTIINCYAKVKVSSVASVMDDAMFTGGLVGGFFYNSNLKNCFATGAVRGDSFVGGLAGIISTNCEIINCYATGDVAGIREYVGGLAGNADDTNFFYCYAAGEVTGNNIAGGLAGSIDAATDIQYCAALNPAIRRRTLSIGLKFGMIAGQYDGNDLSKTHRWKDIKIPDGTLTGSHGGIPIDTIAAAKSKTVYEDTMGWPFGSTDLNPWMMDESSSYPLPVLYWQTEASYPVLPEHLE